MIGSRVCPVCGVSLEGRRCHARYCGGPCRAEASRIRALVDGKPVAGYASLAEWEARRARRNRTNRPREA